MKGNISVAWVLLAAAVALSSCGGTSSQYEPPPETAPDGLSYPDPNLFTMGVPITPLVPFVAKGTPTNYMVVPDLPPGLRLEGDGTISGTPTAPKSPGTYLVTAGNADGTTSFGVRITVVGRYTIGGTVSGLSGGGLVLSNNGDDNLTVNADGPFTFETLLGAGAAYAVTVATQPAGQTCSVALGSGRITNDNFGRVAVTCSATTNKAGRSANSLNDTLRAMASDHAGRLRYEACFTATSDPSVPGYVIDQTTGAVTLFADQAPDSSALFRVSPGIPLPNACGPAAVTMDPDIRWVSVAAAPTDPPLIYIGARTH
jgi:hypothetical protein